MALAASVMGECRDWRKVKTVAWREANRERWRLFERPVTLSCWWRPPSTPSLPGLPPRSGLSR